MNTIKDVDRLQVTKYFITNSENNEVEFNILDFFYFQRKIAEKFPNPKKKEIEMVDSFILHIIEESEEYMIEKEIGDSRNKERIEEFIDCIMYTFSFLSTLISRYQFLEDLLNQEKIKINTDGYKDEELQTIINNSLVWKIRRLYPERKYHKVYKELNQSDKDLRAFKVYEIFIELIQKLIDKLYYETSSMFTITDINRMIRNKQHYILFKL